jgi:hypothetical protein
MSLRDGETTVRRFGIGAKRYNILPSRSLSKFAEDRSVAGFR